MKNILVTGGAGYIGATLVPMLLHQGYHVTVVDNFMYRQNSLAHVCHHDNLKLVKADIRRTDVLKSSLKDADVIIPLAALVGAPICSQDPVGARSINRDAILDLLKLASTNQLVIMPTTNSAYGSGDKNNFCTEESELNPISQYAIEKVEIEKTLMERENSISFRLATVFGMSPRMRTDLLVNDFTYRAFNDRFIVLFESHFKRNYIHVIDVARAMMHALDHYEKMKHNIFNVGLSSANLSKRELCEVIKSHIPQFTILESEIEKDTDQRNYIVSNEKLENTGFKPDFTLDQGVQELIKGYAMIRDKVYCNI